MGGFTADNFAAIAIGIILMILVFKFIKGIIKSVLILILAVVVFGSLYNIVINKKSLSYEINRYKTDIVYIVKVKDITKEVKALLNDDSKGVEETSFGLDEIITRAQNLEHSEEISGIANSYLAGLKTIRAGVAAQNTDVGEYIESHKEIFKPSYFKAIFQ